MKQKVKISNGVIKKKKMGVGFGVMIYKNKQVLLGQRHDDPRKADSLWHGQGTWTMPVGKLDCGEDLKKAAIREVTEETGIKLKKGNLKLISLTNDIVSDAHFVTIGFLCQKFTGKARVVEPDEITKWQWFNINDLPRPMYFPSEKILKNYLDKKIYKN